MSILSLQNVEKIYAGGHKALDNVSIEVHEGEIFALLGPNGAGKTSLISAICGLITPSSGKILVGGHDAVKDYRKARALIGLVPQELVMDGFETVFNALKFSRRLFGLSANDDYLEEILRSLSLWEKRDSSCMTLSGGMKRRVLIAKALAHEPKLLFLDEPTAGVDVSLRKDMWALVQKLKDQGTTIILTTHYIEEAEEMADRVGIIRDGKILLIEEKSKLMKQMGKKELTIALDKPLKTMPKSLIELGMKLAPDGESLLYEFDTKAERTGIRRIFMTLEEENISVADMDTRQSSLEEIFVELVGEKS